MASSSMSVGVEEREEGARERSCERTERNSLLLINGGRAFQAERGDEAGPHSHGWAPHCKQGERAEAAFPS
ncbi:hypothetical protein CesoFtcFv8_000583 [Champsocephalus esox]|uniref:Uncharacterized protein n=1 Tax=Champsocephalus esox TaxID=159716 RepID=A0AAN8HG19_9TELE|nr:hypothetical protein CesoFtcFv8_000583 [Champsocephalus esox]